VQENTTLFNKELESRDVAVGRKGGREGGRGGRRREDCEVGR